MPIYSAPEKETLFILKDLLQLDSCDKTDALAKVDGELLDAIISEAGRFCNEVVAPLNPIGDQQGCTRHEDGSVTTPEGFKEAYAAYIEAGWGTLALSEEYGGQGLPHALSTIYEEYANSACHAFNMFPGLTHGAVSAIMTAGSDEQKQTYLPKLISGEWLGTMALTESGAGSDLGLLRTKAEKQGDGAYAINGEKIFCSGGEQDLTENIIHLVLARIPGSPAGSRGLSLFIVPKILPDTGAKNTVSCNSIEHKMGLHGSATCVMNFDDAQGFLLGHENAGLAAMFVMMNAARLSCGNQGLAQAELAYQNALAYALDRKQGRASGERADPSQAADPIIVHADVRRMLLDARSFTEGLRALISWTALQLDIAHGSPDEEERKQADALVSFLTPVLKAFGTQRGFETAVDMQQIFGGHGYVSEWGMEQIVRDARVAMIYEGANGIQAMDLVGRKLLKDGGAAANGFFDLVEKAAHEAPDEVGHPLIEALEEARLASQWLGENAGEAPDRIAGGAYAYLELIGTLAIGAMWARIAKLCTDKPEGELTASKLKTARFYAAYRLPECAMLHQRIMKSGYALEGVTAENFSN